MTERISNLNANEYEHPFDRDALSTLRGTPGLEAACKFIISHGYEKMISTQYTGSCVRINNNNCPRLYQNFLDCCRILDITVPALYVQSGYEINAFTIGNEKPIIVLNSGTVDFLNENELRYIIAHELGHIKSKHMLYHMMGEIIKKGGILIGQATLGLGKVFTKSLEAALCYWSRMSEFTADRAGLLVCQDINTVASVMMKLSGLPLSLYNQTDPQEFIKQADEFRSLDMSVINKYWRIFMQLDQTHPWTVLRTAELIKWVESGQFDDITKYRNPKIEIVSTKERKIYCSSCKKEIKLSDKKCPHCDNPTITFITR